MLCVDFSGFAYEILLVQHPMALKPRGRERERKRDREREREKGPGFTSRCKWSPCSSNYSGSWSEQTHWERDSAASATGTVSKSLLIALMNIGLASKQEELISAVYACNPHTARSSVTSARQFWFAINCSGGFFRRMTISQMCCWEGLSFSQKGKIMSSIKCLNNVTYSNKKFLSNLCLI
jgi:hypothetical protein